MVVVVLLLEDSDSFWAMGVGGTAHPATNDPTSTDGSRSVAFVV